MVRVRVRVRVKVKVGVGVRVRVSVRVSEPIRTDKSRQDKATPDKKRQRKRQRQREEDKFEVRCMAITCFFVGTRSLVSQFRPRYHCIGLGLKREMKKDKKSFLPRGTNQNYVKTRPMLELEQGQEQKLALATECCVEEKEDRFQNCFSIAQQCIPKDRDRWQG